MITTERFTGRVESYRHYRPQYPKEIVGLLRSECSMKNNSSIADVAAGTGLLTEIFLAEEFSVTAVEPNSEMRAACEALAAQYPKLRCVPGTAEATTLPAHSIDMITVGQAMHWFDLGRSRAEFIRILRPHGWCAIIYNNRRMGGDAFHEGYENLLRDFGIDYAAVQGKHLSPEKIEKFFASSAMKQAVFANAQLLTLDGLEGRILSSSYMPSVDHPRHSAMRSAITKLFIKHETNGFVRLEYECVVCYGQL